MVEVYLQSCNLSFSYVLKIATYINHFLKSHVSQSSLCILVVLDGTSTTRNNPFPVGNYSELCSAIANSTSPSK